MKRVVVVGTGTGIGKTHLGVALVAELARSGLRVVGLKPVESGVCLDRLDETDAGLLASVSSVRLAEVGALYAFAPAVSPHLAARQASVLIDLERIAGWVAQVGAGTGADVAVVETAGALLSPLSRTLTNLDLARALRPDCLVLVGCDRLGVLHDVAATLHALRTLAPELGEATLVLQPPALPDTSTGANAAELAFLGLGQPIVFPRVSPTDAACLKAAHSLATRLGLLRDEITS